MREECTALTLKGERKGQRSEMLSILLLFKLFGPVNVRVGDFDPVNDDAQASDDLGDERFFLDAVAVAERVSVKQDIAGDGFSVDRKKSMHPETAQGREETRIRIVQGGAAVGARTDQIRSKIIRDIPSEAYLTAEIGAGQGISYGQSGVRNQIQAQTG